MADKKIIAVLGATGAQGGGEGRRPLAVVESPRMLNRVRAAVRPERHAHSDFMSSLRSGETHHAVNAYRREHQCQPSQRAQ